MAKTDLSSKNKDELLSILVEQKKEYLTKDLLFILILMMFVY